MYMASTSYLTFTLSKFPQRLTKKDTSLNPCGRTHFAKQFRNSQRFSILSVSKSSWSRANSSLRNSAYVDSAKEETPAQVEVKTCMWNWKGYSIRYQYAGSSGPALVLIHGFGANSGSNSFQQCRQTCLKFPVITQATGLVGLQAAVMEPQICKGILLLNISLRMLHIKKQPWFGRPLIRSFQNLLRNTALGKYFFNTIATPDSVKNILCQCYHETSQVTDELVQAILLPGLEPGAADVFLEFICYSEGPLPEELLPQVKCPVLVAWGEKDPWEPIELGRAYGNFDTVEDFIVLPDVGHCPQDEAPHLVNPLVETFVTRHATPTC